MGILPLNFQIKLFLNNNMASDENAFVQI